MMGKDWESSFPLGGRLGAGADGRVRFPWERKALEPRPKQGQRPGLPGRHCCGEGTGACRCVQRAAGWAGREPGGAW